MVYRELFHRSSNRLAIFLTAKRKHFVINIHSKFSKAIEKSALPRIEKTNYWWWRGLDFRCNNSPIHPTMKASSCANASAMCQVHSLGSPTPTRYFDEKGELPQRGDIWYLRGNSTVNFLWKTEKYAQDCFLQNIFTIPSLTRAVHGQILKWRLTPNLWAVH